MGTVHSFPLGFVGAWRTASFTSVPPVNFALICRDSPSRFLVMKDPLERTKVVMRHLPPSLTHPALTEQIDSKFAGRYNWFCFRHGKNSQKNQRCSCAYIDFKNPEDVFEFAEFFDGHVFVNEKGTQFRALVEYAPYQCVPKHWTRKDVREGTILRDPEYLEFLEILARPVENLPSAEIQIERREAERVGASKMMPIVTPLMDFVRQKRAAKSGSQRSSGNGKSSRRAVGTGNRSGPSSKHGSEKRRQSTLMYASIDFPKNESRKKKSTYILMSRREVRHDEKSSNIPSANGADAAQNDIVAARNGTESGVPVAAETGEKILLSRGKEREGSLIHPHVAAGSVVRSILSNKKGNQMASSQPDWQTGNGKKDKRPFRAPVPWLTLKDHASSGSPQSSASDAVGKSHIVARVASTESHASGSISNKQEKRLRNKDRPDRGVWAPLSRSNGSLGTGANLLLANEMPVGHRYKHDIPTGNRSSECKSLLGAHWHSDCLGATHGSREVDCSENIPEGKSFKRGPTGFSPHERQVWVQKSGSAS